MGVLFCKSQLFSLLLLSFLSFSSSLSTLSVAETSDLTLVCALVPSAANPQISSLNCSGLPPGIQAPFDPNLSFSGIVSGDGFLCGLRRPFAQLNNASVLHCWRFFGNGTTIEFKRIYSGASLNQLEAGNNHICGTHNGTDSVECWQWPGFNQNSTFSTIAVGKEFVCGTSTAGNIGCLGNVPEAVIAANQSTGNYSMIAAGFSHVCAIDLSNDLTCWGDAMEGDIPQGKFNSVALGLNRSCALSTNGTVQCWGLNNFSLPQELRTQSFITIKAKRSVFCGVLTLNYSVFCWGNDSRLNSSSMVLSEVLPGPCRSTCPCGSVPRSALYCDNGESICQACNVPLQPITPPPWQPSPNPPSSSGLNGKMIAFLVVGCVGSFCLFLVCGFFGFRYCKGSGCRVHDSGRLDETGTPAVNGATHQPQPPLVPAVLEKRLSQLTSMGATSRLEEFSFETLIQASNNFSEDHKIGTGSFGSVYHATLDDGREVAIKRAEVTSTSSYAVGTKRQEDKDNAFVNELEYLSRLHHKNLVRLLGFYEDSKERVLVYEFMKNGTLHDHLYKFQNSPLMSWSARIKIALDAARGIQYLHEYAVPAIIHRDIKSSNILLDANLAAKVSDFGLSLLGPEDNESHLSMRAAGTVGYIDPEYYRLQQLTTKSDVYSFGVILLELLSGQKAIYRNENGETRHVVDFVVPYILRDEIHRVLDPKVPPPTPFEIEAVAYVGYLAGDCVTAEGRYRPSMTEVVNTLEKALEACLANPVFSRSSTESSTELTNLDV